MTWKRYDIQLLMDIDVGCKFYVASQHKRETIARLFCNSETVKYAVLLNNTPT